MKKEPAKRLFSQILPIGLADYYYNNVTALCRIRQHFIAFACSIRRLGGNNGQTKKDRTEFQCGQSNREEVCSDERGRDA